MRRRQAVQHPKDLLRLFPRVEDDQRPGMLLDFLCQAIPGPLLTPHERQLVTDSLERTEELGHIWDDLPHFALKEAAGQTPALAEP